MNTPLLNALTLAARETTYVIFDGDTDMWAYGFMKGWNVNPHCNFIFADAHDLLSLTSRAENEAYIKSQLRQRMAAAKQVIVIIGENTRNLYKFVRWELELAVSLNLPIIAANLNGSRQMDDLCPPILREQYVLFVPFKMAAITHALAIFPGEHARRTVFSPRGPRILTPETYRQLGV